MPTEGSCNECSWGPETDPEQPFDSNTEARSAAQDHVHSEVVIEDIWVENQPADLKRRQQFNL